MGKIFDATPEPLGFLLESIHNREMALPDFQRDFVWDPSATEELIESICQSFPAGSLLRIRNQNGFFFAPREFTGAPDLGEHAPSYLILDGQQRLTSLYQAFYGSGAHHYFVDLGGLINGNDLEDCVFYLRERDANRQYGTMELQAKTLVFPLAKLFGDPGGFEEWLDNVLEIRPELGDEMKRLRQQLRDVKNLWLRPIDNYEFPMVTLADGTGPGAVCTIFETLNRTGVKLSVFDLLAARFWPEDVRLRDLWEKAQIEHPIIAEYDVDPYYILQAISLRTATSPSCKRSDVLKMEVSQITGSWHSVVEGMGKALTMLRSDCGVVLPKWLPSMSMLIPMAAFFSLIENLNGPELGATYDKIKRWYWCSVFGQAYEKAANSQAAKDYVELKRWVSEDTQPETVVDFRFDYESLPQVTPRQRGIYRGCLALILKNGARDFHNCKQMTANMIAQENIDDHHVFPQAWIDENLPEITAAKRDCILNRTLIDKVTNIRISKRAPSDYFGEIKEAIGEEKLVELMTSHLLPSNSASGLYTDDFETFIAQRGEVLSEQIRMVTG